MTGREAAALLTQRPAQVARACGYPLLTDELHGAWLRQMMREGEDMTLLAHRSSYKTTCLAMAAAALMVLRPEESILVMRKTEQGAAELVRQVRLILQTPVMRELTAGLYGAPVGFRQATAMGLSCECYAAPRGAFQLAGCSVGTAITGRHAERIFTDDIVNLKDRVSPQERARTRSIYMELQNVRGPGGRIVNIGTPWHKDDAISLMPNVRKFDCYSTGLMTRERLEALRGSMSPSLFAANYELRHIAMEDALFPTAPGMFEDERLLWDGMAHLDASYGGEDCTALTLGRRDGETVYLYGRLWQGHVDRHVEEILAVCGAMRCGPILCETNADRGYLAKELRRRGAQVRMYRESCNKYVKIATWLRKWWPRVRFHVGTDAEYLAQVLDYGPNAAHDDAPDSAACLCRALDRGAQASW